MIGRNRRAVERMHVRCPLCKGRITDRDRVQRVPRLGWCHSVCPPAGATKRP